MKPPDLPLDSPRDDEGVTQRGQHKAPRRTSPVEIRSRALRILDASAILHPTVRAAVDYLHIHFTSDECDISRLASEVALSPKYLSELFHKVTGFTLHEYMQTLRIRYALKWVGENPYQTITAAAHASGFRSLRTFEWWFKKLAKTTPVQHRRDVRNWLATQPPDG